MINPSLRSLRTLLLAWWVVGVLANPPRLPAATNDTERLRLDASMLHSSSAQADFSGLVDEPDQVGNPPTGKPQRGWRIPSQYWKHFPYSVTLDLGREQNLAALWAFDTNGKGQFTVAAGHPGAWQTVTQYDCGRYLKWVRLPLDVTSRYLRIELQSPGANFAEIALDAYRPAAHRAMLARQAAAAKQQAERAAALERARKERARRPWTELPPFGRVRLVDEVDCGAGDPGHQFVESPAGASRLETILGRPCRALRKTPNECAYMAFRLGRWKGLQPGKGYVLAVEYPEDQPRSWVVMNGGNETSRGFHTGNTFGDALHPKYVNNHNESIQVPLSGKIETWRLYFNLHDRFPDLKFLRGAGERPLTAEDGFTVAIAQFSARNIPASAGAAVARVRLFEIQDEKQLAQPVHFPPAPLPRRHIFWREEMADGVIHSDRETERGVKHRLDWYRYKANQMRFLGIRTFSKDLLEFGACQHWDSTPYGGNDWVYHNWSHKGLWAEIVALMGREGFDVLPYYEYSGSKGQHGLGNQRRCQPLTRDDAYTHISWVETANADLTDPDTYEDFKKMLDLTVIRLKDKAPFAGIWLRPRWQLPMSFADATRKRFAREANRGKLVSRAELIRDSALLRRYEAWWFGKRRQFLVAMRDYLRSHGVANPVVLFTAEGSESGVGFASWEKRIVTDNPAHWKPILRAPEHLENNKPITPISLARVAQNDLYLEGLLAPPLNWGNWEVQHANPPADPERYRDTEGVLMTHAFNRLYTVSSPKTFDAFRGAGGLAIVRHYSLNENMMFDRKDQPKLGYFVADIERAGPYCMMAEALALANGDPTMIGYLMGNNFGRGFPQYVREFNANFLALPALPSRRMSDVADDPAIVARVIQTKTHGAYVALVNTAFTAKTNVAIRLPGSGIVREAVTGRPLPLQERVVRLSFYPFQLHALHLDRL